MKKGLLVGLFVVAIVHAVFSALFALGMKSYFWYASALASLLVANILGHNDVVRAEITRKS